MRRAATPDTVGGIELDEGPGATDAALGQPQSPSSIINIDSVLAAPQAKRPFAQIPGKRPEPRADPPKFAAPHTRPPRRSLPRSDSAATLEVLERSGSGTLDSLDAPSESTSLDGDDALFDGLDDIVDAEMQLLVREPAAPRDEVWLAGELSPVSVMDVDAEALRVIERAARKRLPRPLTAQSQVVAKLLARSLQDLALHGASSSNCAALVECTNCVDAATASTIIEAVTAYAPASTASLDAFASSLAEAASIQSRDLQHFRMTWSPVARYVVQRRKAQTLERNALCAFELWAVLEGSGKAFDAKCFESLEARAVASSLADALVQAAPGSVEALETLAKSGADVVRRAGMAYSADDVRAVTRALQHQATLDDKLERLAALVSLLNRGGPLDAAQLAYAELAEDAGDAALRSAVASARDDLVQAKEPHAIWLARSEVYAYDASTFEADESTRALDRLTRMAVSSDSKEWGRSTNRRCAVVEQVPECRDMAPRHLALALLFFNGDGVFMHSPQHLASLEAVVADAELAKQPRAAWLPPYRLEVAPGVFVTLRDKAIRDPFDGATRVVTVRVSA